MIEQLEVTLNTSNHRFQGWIRDYQTFKHKLRYPNVGGVCYDEEVPYLLYHAPSGSFKIYWQQLSRKALIVYIKPAENCKDLSQTQAYIKELLRAAVDDFSERLTMFDHEFEAEHLQNLHQQIKIYQRNLDCLCEQEAKYGPLNVPTNIRNEIKETKEKIAEIKEEIEKVDAEIEGQKKRSAKVTDKKPFLGMIAQGKTKGWIS